MNRTFGGFFEAADLKRSCRATSENSNILMVSVSSQLYITIQLTLTLSLT